MPYANRGLKPQLPVKHLTTRLPRTYELSITQYTENMWMFLKNTMTHTSQQCTFWKVKFPRYCHDILTIILFQYHIKYLQYPQFLQGSKSQSSKILSQTARILCPIPDPTHTQVSIYAAGTRWESQVLQRDRPSHRHTHGGWRKCQSASFPAPGRVAIPALHSLWVKSDSYLNTVWISSMDT